MVEIGLGVMVSQCLDRRIPTKAILLKEAKTWKKRRNREKARTRRSVAGERRRSTIQRF